MSDDTTDRDDNPAVDEPEYLHEPDGLHGPDPGPDDPPAPPADATPPDDPHRMARAYLAGLKPPGPPWPLRYWRGDFVIYDGSRYRLVPDEDVRARLSAWADREFTRQHREQLAVWQPPAAGSRGRGRPRRGEGQTPPEKRPVTRSVVADLSAAIEGLAFLPAYTLPPAWINGATGPDPRFLLPTVNGILDLAAAADGAAGCLLPASANFFTPTAVAYPFAPTAPRPERWLAFLDSLWGHDPESIASLQEWMGYLLTTDTSHQKILFIIGVPGGGKSTIARVMTELVGADNVVNPRLGELAGPFGLEPLLGRSVALIGDARLGARSDATAITEVLLSVSGEDIQAVGRKHRSTVVGKLPIRFVLMSNELPRLRDTSGAFTRRLVILRASKTFDQKPDIGLFDRVRPEMPGILLWAVEGLKRLRDRGQFLQATSGLPLVRVMKEVSSDVGVFVREECVTGPGLKVPTAEVYAGFEAWCKARGVKDVPSETVFGRDLFSVVADLDKRQVRIEGKQVRHYFGLRLRGEYEGDEAEPAASEAVPSSRVPSAGRREYRNSEPASAARTLPGGFDDQDG